jgi:hypothetical protein
LTEIQAIKEHVKELMLKPEAVKVVLDFAPGIAKMFGIVQVQHDGDELSCNDKQTNSMTSRRYIIYCAKRWPNCAGSAIPGARTFLREPEGSVATCRCVGEGAVETCRCRW